nr:MAG TPA: hypothetical protein [Caudoviricetes sp.]
MSNKETSSTCTNDYCDASKNGKNKFSFLHADSITEIIRFVNNTPSYKKECFSYARK